MKDWICVATVEGIVQSGRSGMSSTKGKYSPPPHSVPSPTNVHPEISAQEITTVCANNTGCATAATAATAAATNPAAP